MSIRGNSFHNKNLNKLIQDFLHQQFKLFVSWLGDLSVFFSLLCCCCCCSCNCCWCWCCCCCCCWCCFGFVVVVVVVVVIVVVFAAAAGVVVVAVVVVVVVHPVSMWNCWSRWGLQAVVVAASGSSGGAKGGDQQTRPSSSRWPPAHSLYTMLCLGKDTYRRRPVRYRPLMLRCPFLWLLLLQLPDPVCHWISGEEEEKPSRNKPIECRNTAKWYFW